MYDLHDEWRDAAPANWGATRREIAEFYGYDDLSNDPSEAEILSDLADSAYTALLATGVWGDEYLQVGPWETEVVVPEAPQAEEIDIPF